MVSEKGLQIERQISGHWSEESEKRSVLKTRWWQVPLIVRHINQRVCGRTVEGLSQGLNEVVRAKLSTSLPFAKGISIGSGNAFKELNLIRQGFVDHFDLFELSARRIEEGLETAEKWGISRKVTFHHGCGFECTSEESVDFVHWNNSLHHMLDVDFAVSWSHKVLRAGGMFYMDDFIGPRRFQWSDRSLTIASQVRGLLPPRYLKNPNSAEALLPKQMRRPDPLKLEASDPSEAADSDRILPSVMKHFPEAEVVLTGGVIYHLALSDAIANFNEVEDRLVLEVLLLLDDLCVELGESLYATALALKGCVRA
jgi:SAM-dependent methyltransferase